MAGKPKQLTITSTHALSITHADKLATLGTQNAREIILGEPGQFFIQSAATGAVILQVHFSQKDSFFMVFTERRAVLSVNGKEWINQIELFIGGVGIQLRVT